ncbi:hypothetical protein MTBBW1_1310041 [Desulfamplus magnetovallimortis]|uniref:Uncharacterized protein n=1 Tax=Desulfamplus magnetovallimortis TaxID=1246637 RepID=A0A1W1H7A2_9BACT|nr:hypothetical protein MTBBW1_1310041 [Desulfamplus magnetovallimortis]
MGIIQVFLMTVMVNASATTKNNSSATTKNKTPGRLKRERLSFKTPMANHSNILKIDILLLFQKLLQLSEPG